MLLLDPHSDFHLLFSRGGTGGGWLPASRAGVREGRGQLPVLKVEGGKEGRAPHDDEDEGWQNLSLAAGSVMGARAGQL